VRNLRGVATWFFGGNGVAVCPLARVLNLLAMLVNWTCDQLIMLMEMVIKCNKTDV
jgi:hypothetical protein